MLNAKTVINDLLVDVEGDLDDILKVAKVLEANEECLEKLIAIKDMVIDCIDNGNDEE